jgi:mono/diheme cytochrome c family protein
MENVYQRSLLARVPFWVAAAALLPLVSLRGSAQTATPPPQTLQQASTTVLKYCATCHSARLHTAGLVLDQEAIDQAPANAERWEKVIRKLEAKSMPPPGVPRPDAATYEALKGYLATELDRAAAANPNPGKLPLLHRLTRTEYQNAVRDLLALDALPKEMEYSMLLPQDNAMSGFDNIADLLFVSPTSMESYLGAAEKISRLAMGDPSAPVMFNTYRMPDEQPQTARVDDGLPYGTRGGLAIKSDFPQDGEYAVKVTFAGSSDQDQKLEITVDGERVRLETIAVGGRGGRGGRGGAAGAGGAAQGSRAAQVSAQVDDDTDPGYGRGGRGPVEVRIPVKAGPRLIGVAFLERNEVRDEQVLRPRMRGIGPALAVGIVTVSGPYNAKGPGDTPTRQRIFVCRPASVTEEAPCARRILSTLARRAYRRRVTDEDVQSLMPFYTAGRAEGGFDLGIQRALQRLLMSPQFLFRMEHDPPNAVPGSSHPVTDLELASRLSFFLWSSIPDDELLNLASQEKLRQPGVLEQQVRRMLADPRSSSLVTNFAEQWLYLRDIEAKRPNEILFPDFDESLRAAFREETDLFLDSVLRGNVSVLELLSANYTFVNERLAKHYGIPNIHGPEFHRVTFPPGSPRGGLLGQGSLLTITSYANRTSPVNRGKWVLENLLSAPPPPPPPNVPALKTEGNETGKTLTMRQAMLQHRANPVCASCHARMDPIGFAMENFDPVGRWRDRDAGNPIDASGAFPDGQKFDGMAGLKAELLSHPEEFVSTVSEKLLMYGLGRNVQYFDRPAIRAIVAEGARNNYTFASLVLGVVKSAPFEMRQTQAATDTKSPETKSVAR